jgi:hypothetical protein
MVIVPHPPYSPDLAPVISFCFPKLKMGRHFETVCDIRRDSHAALDSIKENYFHGAFEAWKKRWARYIRSQGDYFEGNDNQN